MRVRSSYESAGKHFNFQLGEVEFLVEGRPDRDVAGRLDSLQAAIEHLGQQFPEAYPVPALRQRLEALRTRVAQQAAAETADAAAGWQAVTAELEALQREALVSSNPLFGAGPAAVRPAFHLPDRLVLLGVHASGTFRRQSVRVVAGRRCGDRIGAGLRAGCSTATTCRATDGGSCSATARPPDKAFRLYEIGSDGGGLRQLTFDPPGESERLASYGPTPGKNELGPWRGHTDDFHPCYLPDGGICFASSRCERGVLCDVADNLSVNVLYRMDADGGNLRGAVARRAQRIDAQRDERRADPVHPLGIRGQGRDRGPVAVGHAAGRQRHRPRSSAITTSSRRC